MTTLRTLALAASILAAIPITASASGLGGSPRSMRTQHDVAIESEYSFFSTPAAVTRAAEKGLLVKISGGPDHELSKISFPYARPQVALFIERLAAQYADATGSRLVVTSLTRPSSRQPGNAHALSVHPTGMALDLRVPANGEARAWLERTLLELENAKVLDVTRERNPAHYHVAIYPEAYREYAAAHPMPPRVAYVPPAKSIARVIMASTAPAVAPVSPFLALALLFPLPILVALRRADARARARRS